MPIVGAKQNPPSTDRGNIRGPVASPSGYHRQCILSLRPYQVLTHLYPQGLVGEAWKRWPCMQLLHKATTSPQSSSAGGETPDALKVALLFPETEIGHRAWGLQS